MDSVKEFLSLPVALYVERPGVTPLKTILMAHRAAEEAAAQVLKDSGADCVMTQPVRLGVKRPIRHPRNPKACNCPKCSPNLWPERQTKK